MANSGAYKHGNKGAVTIGGYVLPTTSFGYTEKADNQDVMNARSNGFGEDIAGNKRCEGNCECIWDADQYPHDTPLNLKAGSEVAMNVVLHSGETGMAPTVIIGDVVRKSGVKGAVTYSFDWKTQGEYTLP